MAGSPNRDVRGPGSGSNGDSEYLHRGLVLDTMEALYDEYINNGGVYDCLEGRSVQLMIRGSEWVLLLPYKLFARKFALALRNHGVEHVLGRLKDYGYRLGVNDGDRLVFEAYVPAACRENLDDDRGRIYRYACVRTRELNQILTMLKMHECELLRESVRDC